MKPIYRFSIIMLLSGLSLSTMSLVPSSKIEVEGAWIYEADDSETTVVFSDGYFSCTRYSVSDKKFLLSFGGPFTISDNTLTVKTEFNTGNAEVVGSQQAYDLQQNDDILNIKMDGKTLPFKRVDKGNANLAGTWKITGRKQNGVLTQIHQTGARKTLKILSATRFQWAAINPETKEFFGTGGGTYTLNNGVYKENIEFFSRDSSRIGMSLQFQGEIIEGQWHHSGKSSRGDDIYEVWSRVQQKPID